MSFAVEKPLDKDRQAAFRDEARLVDEPYKLFLVAKAIRQQNALWITDYSAISEFILINNGIYIAPRSRPTDTQREQAIRERKRAF